MMKNFETPFLWIGEDRCLDFVNTQLMVEGRLADLLGDFGEVSRWSLEAGLISQDEALALARRGAGEGKAQDGKAREEALLQARALRSVLREMAEGLAVGQEVKAEAVAEINRHLAHRAGHLRVAARGMGFEREFEARLRDEGDVVARVAGAAADFLCERDLSRVKRCGNPGCVLVFLDTTKSRTRRWCSMGMCGNRSKSAAHYARRKGAR